MPREPKIVDLLKHFISQSAIFSPFFYEIKQRILSCVVQHPAFSFIGQIIYYGSLHEQGTALPPTVTCTLEWRFLCAVRILHFWHLANTNVVTTEMTV